MHAAGQCRDDSSGTSVLWGGWSSRFELRAQRPASLTTSNCSWSFRFAGESRAFGYTDLGRLGSEAGPGQRGTRNAPGRYDLKWFCGNGRLLALVALLNKRCMRIPKGLLRRFDPPRAARHLLMAGQKPWRTAVWTRSGSLRPSTDPFPILRVYADVIRACRSRWISTKSHGPVFASSKRYA
jgi:hypothetical protein